MITRRRVLGTALVPLATAVAVPAVAWACSVQTELGLAFNRGAARSQVEVRGTAFSPGAVELHWNTVSGPVLAAVSGPRFDTTVTVPDAAPNVYYLVAVQNSSGGLVTKAAAAFEVTAPAGGGGVGAWGAAGGSRQASLLESPVSSGRDVSLTTAGAVVLAGGLVAISAGFGLAELRRRRVLASSPPPENSRLLL